MSTLSEVDHELAALMASGDYEALEEYLQRQREANKDAIIERSDEVNTWRELLHLTGVSPGRNELPVLLADLCYEGWFVFRPDELAPAIEDAWTGSEFPLRQVEMAFWLELFEETGFIYNTVSDEAARPREPITLYRGATQDAAAGMSWTDRVEEAQWFADRFPHLVCKVWTAQVEPSRLLAHFHDPGKSRGEWEWVVDSHGLTVEQLSP